jgi:hypothetical protein
MRWPGRMNQQPGDAGSESVGRRRTFVLRSLVRLREGSSREVGNGGSGRVGTVFRGNYRPGTKRVSAKSQIPIFFRKSPSMSPAPPPPETRFFR